jgi:hypothetical protein
MSSVDYTPVLLAQITDLAMRVTNLESMNSALKAEVERLTGQAVAVKGSASSVKTSIPLTSKMHMSGASSRRENVPNGFAGSAMGGSSIPPRQRPQNSAPFAPSNSKFVPFNPEHKKDNYKQLTINDVLKPNEEVTIKVGVGKDEEGNFIKTTCVTKFDGTQLTVQACDLVPSMVNMSSSKPGHILYKFIEELKNGGHIKKEFTIAPWKICFVERDGKEMSLEELRAQ